MKTFKRIGLGVVLGLILLTIYSLVLPHATLALANTDLKSPPANYKFLALNTIEGTIGGKPYRFTDGRTSDGTWSYQPADGSPFCKPNGVSNDDFGIRLDKGEDPSKGSGNLSATITLGTGAGANCNKITSPIKVTNNGVSSATYEWADTNIETIDGKWTYFPLSDGISADLTGRVYITNTAAGSCGVSDSGDPGEIIILGQAGGNQGTLFQLTTNDGSFAGNDDATTYFEKFSPNIDGIINKGSCRAVQDVISGQNFAPQTISITGTPGTPPIINPPGGGNGTINQTSDACDAIGDTSLNWILCPVVSGLSASANNINGYVQGQLHINIHDNFGNPDGSVKTAWAVFKDIVSVLIVILLLVMVISQAIGGGPFDAYTVKKVLPKLVIAVIAMQLSWDICIWFINLFNDLGSGIGDLIAAPFGGTAALDLPSLLTRLSTAYTAVGAGVGGWVTVLLIPMAVWLYWPWLLIGAFVALMAVIAAMATLLIRNALLIMAVIVAPLALLAWAAPGQGSEKLWKYWYGNFSKALMLFPLVMAMIYGGRIFGWVAGNLGAAGPLDLIMIFVGYFGPYFFLPKTFKWGGSILAGANRGITQSGAYKGIRSGGIKFGKEIDKQWRGSNTRSGPFRYNPNDSRVARLMPRRLTAGLKRKTDENGNPTGEVEKFFGVPKPAIKAYNAVKKVQAGAAEQKLKEAGVDFYTRQSDGKVVPRMADEHFLDKNGHVVNPDKFGNLGYNGQTGEYYKRSFVGVPMWEGRMVGRLFSGKLMPTARGRAQAIQYGADYAEDMNKLAYIYAHRKFQEANDNGYIDHDGKRYAKGVSAAKAAIIDAAGDMSMEGRIAKLAIDDLLQTKSWPEIGGRKITTPGKFKGMYVYETPQWESFIGEKPEHYPDVQRNMYVATPDVQQLKHNSSSEANRAIKERASAGRSTVQNGDRLGRADRVIYSTEVRMKPEMIAGQKEEFFKFALEAMKEELARTGAGKEAGKETAFDVAASLAQKFGDMVRMSTDGATLLGHLNTGQMRSTINEIFKLAATETGYINQENGQAFTLEDFIDQNQKFMNPELGKVTISTPTPHLEFMSQDGGNDEEGPAPSGTTAGGSPPVGGPGGVTPRPTFYEGGSGYRGMGTGSNPPPATETPSLHAANAPATYEGPSRTINHGDTSRESAAVSEALDSLSRAVRQNTSAVREARRAPGNSGLRPMPGPPIRRGPEWPGSPPGGQNPNE